MELNEEEYYVVKIPQVGGYYEQTNWIRDKEIRGWWRRTALNYGLTHEFYFKHVEDAALFQLTWG